MKNKNDLVTVGVVLRNKTELILETLSSVLNQTHTNLEIFIINNNSSDNSLQICRDIDDSRIHIISHSKQHSEIEVFNELIDSAKGFFLTFVSPGDILKPNKIQSQLEYLNKNIEIQIIGTEGYSLTDERKISSYKQLPPIHEDIFEFDTPPFPLHFFTLLGQTQWFRAHTFNHDFGIVFKEEFIQRAHKDSFFHNLKEPLIYLQNEKEFNIQNYIQTKFGFAKIIINNKSTIDGILAYINACFSITGFFFAKAFGLELNHPKNLLSAEERHIETLTFNRLLDSYKSNN